MKDYKNLWAPLFNMLHEGSILFNVLEKLFEVTLETTNSRELKITASYWILDFFKTFTKNRHIQNEFSDKVSHILILKIFITNSLLGN